MLALEASLTMPTSVQAGTRVHVSWETVDVYNVVHVVNTCYAVVSAAELSWRSLLSSCSDVPVPSGFVSWVFRVVPT